MEISASTVNVLKNFASINSNIVIRPGNKIMTMSEAKNILAEAEVPEQFDNIIGIYDLQEFLNVLGLVDKPRVRFDDNFMHIGGTSGRQVVKYYYADVDMLTSPTKPIVMPKPDVWFTLDEDTLSSIKRAAAVFGHSQLSIEASEGCIKLGVVDPENATANEFSIDVDGGYNDANFKFMLNIANLRMVQDTYEVTISKKLISQFAGIDNKVQYWVALEKSSTYGE